MDVENQWLSIMIDWCFCDRVERRKGVRNDEQMLRESVVGGLIDEGEYLVNDSAVSPRCNLRAIWLQ